MLSSPCAVPSSSLEEIASEEALSDDWLSCFEFCDLPPAPSTPVDLPELSDLDCAAGFNISDLLVPGENPPSFDRLEEKPPDSDRSEENPPFCSVSEEFPIVFEPDKAEETAVHLFEHLFTFEAGTSLLQNNISTGSSPHNSDAGSSMAVAENTIFLKDGLDVQANSHGHVTKSSMTQSVSTSRKRQHEDICSDMEGDDAEGKSLLDPSDKRQQRLLRNRELAFESRQRKKCYVSDLEAKCKMLEQERNQLQQQVCFSAAENAVLKEELARMKKLQGRYSVTEPAVLFKDSLPSEFLSLLICLLLVAWLSLWSSPFLVLVLRAVVCLQIHSKGEGLSKEQGDSKICSHEAVDNVQWSLYVFCYHKPFRAVGLVVTGPTRQVPYSSLRQCFRKSLEGASNCREGKKYREKF